MELADLREANLKEAKLMGADLREAKLQDANLRDASLNEADLRGAKMIRAIINYEQLATVKSLEGALMADGSVYDGRFDKKENEQESD